MSTETVEEFRLRARAWLADNLPKLADKPKIEGVQDLDDTEWDRHRLLQRKLWDGGFAGICFPTEYGGLGLTIAHQHAFTQESRPYAMPLLFNVPTFGICLATILDMGSEEQKQQHIPAVLRGDELLVQFLSEPRGGSDLAGVTTRAERDGDEWVLNGAKIWSSGAYAGDYALCLARTDWSVPKHRGLTMFLVKVHQPGVTVRRILQVNGWNEFCEEFFDDVRLPADSVVGEVNGGWAVASRQLYHERTAVGRGSPYVSGEGSGMPTSEHIDIIDVARKAGRLEDPRARELIAEAHTLQVLSGQLSTRVTAGIQGGHLPAPAASMSRLFHAEVSERAADIMLEVAGAAAATDDVAQTGPGQSSHHFLVRQIGSLGGGSSEMARNVISERLLNMPREFAADRDVPFKDVKQGRT